MKPIQIAYEILSESRRLREIFKTNNTNFNAIHANMYSIFECYAHGIVDWEQVRSRYHTSLMEYANLYKDDNGLYEAERSRLFEEYERVLREWKTPLDEYKKISEQKMTSNIVVKKQLSESIAQQHSKQYFNRYLSENDIKHTSRLKSWKRVMEAYPNLTAKDEERVRMLTILEAPTMDTTQMVNMSETGGFNPRAGTLNQPANPANQGLMDPGFEFNPRAGTMNQPANPANRGLTTTSTAPATSVRPTARPNNLVQRSNVNKAVSQAMGEAEDDKIDTTAFDATSLQALQDLKSRYPHAKDTFDALLNAYMDVKTASIRDDEELEQEIDKNIDRLDRGAKRIADLETRISQLTKELADDEDKLDGVRDDTKIKDLIARIEKLEQEHRKLTTESVSDEKLDDFHKKLDDLVHAYIGYGPHEKQDMDERKMSKSEKAKEKRLKKKYDDSGMKKSMKDQYGDRWEDVYYATIRKRAMENFNASSTDKKDDNKDDKEENLLKALKQDKKRKEEEEEKKKKDSEGNDKNKPGGGMSRFLKTGAQAAIAAKSNQNVSGMFGSGGNSVTPQGPNKGSTKTESTTSGSIASVSKPMGSNKMVRRKGVAPNALDQNKFFDDNNMSNTTAPTKSVKPKARSNSNNTAVNKFNKLIGNLDKNTPL